MVRARRLAMGDVQSQPITGGVGVDGIRGHPDVYPRMAGQVAGIASEEIAADIARSQATSPAAGEEQMGMVLAHAFAPCQRSGCRQIDGGSAGGVTNGFAYQRTQVLQALQAQRGRHHLAHANRQHVAREGRRVRQGVVRERLGEQGAFRQRCHCRIGGGERRGSEINQRRQAAVIGNAAIATAEFGFHDAIDREAQLRMRFVHGEQMADIAERVDLLGTPARRGEFPFQRALARFAARRQTQLLHGVVHLAFVAVERLVVNMQAHQLDSTLVDMGTRKSCAMREPKSSIRRANVPKNSAPNCGAQSA